MQWARAHHYTQEKDRMHILGFLNDPRYKNAGFFGRIALHRANNIAYEERGIGALLIAGSLPADQVGLAQDIDRKRETMRTALKFVILFIGILLLTGMAFYLFVKSKHPIQPGSIVVETELSSLVSSKASSVSRASGHSLPSRPLRASMRYRRGLVYGPKVFAPEMIFQEYWQWIYPCWSVVTKNICRTVRIPCGARRHFCSRNGGYSFPILCQGILFPVYFDWFYSRWFPISRVTISVNIIKVNIKLEEKQLVFYLINLLNNNFGKLGFLSGVVQTILLTVLTADITYTTSSYQYSIVV
jgi:hypothetical protein